MQEYAEWLRPRLVASVWWCGDDYCDCTKPVIERITPNTNAGYPWIQREQLWEGRFLTRTYEYAHEEREELQYAPLRQACHRLGVAVPSEAVMRLAGPVGTLP
jgi:hypothetical protein